MKLRLTLTALFAVTTTSVVASAQQPFIKDRRLGEGIGIRTGNLELHPGFASEFGYDSNYFQRAPGEGPNGEGPVPFWRLRLTPHISLSTLTAKRRDEEGPGEPPVVNFRAGAFVSYNELFTADSSKAADGSDYRNLAAGANFFADILPERPWGADIYGDYQRVAEPSNSPNEQFAFNRDGLRAGAGITWRPGGGLFSWRAGYELDTHIFEKSAFKYLNNAQHAIKTRTRWKFLPRTALISDAEYDFVRYSSDQLTQNDGEMLQGRIGLNGLITNHFGLLAMAGWASTFFRTSSGGVPAQNYDGPVAQAEIRWYIQPAPTLEATSAAVGLSSVGLGYTRFFDVGYYSTFYVRDRGYLDVSYLLGGLFVIGAEAGLSQLHFPTVFYPPGGLLGQVRTDSFSQTRVDASLFAEYRFSDVVGLNTTIRYDQTTSDKTIPPAPGVNDVKNGADDLSFKRFQAYAGLRVFW
jgi:hypothetical protein